MFLFIFTCAVLSHFLFIIFLLYSCNSSFYKTWCLFRPFLCSLGRNIFNSLSFKGNSFMIFLRSNCQVVYISPSPLPLGSQSTFLSLNTLNNLEVSKRTEIYDFYYQTLLSVRIGKLGGIGSVFGVSLKICLLLAWITSSSHIRRWWFYKMIGNLFRVWGSLLRVLKSDHTLNYLVYVVYKVESSIFIKQALS